MPSNNYIKRLRVFAGPNGSGKSTIINAIRQYKINGRSLDFWTYVNADDIATALGNDTFSFDDYELEPITRKELVDLAKHSGLIRDGFSGDEFKASFTLNAEGRLRLKKLQWKEHLAQVMAMVLREKLLMEQRKMSFETVFSHPSKLDFMRRANEMGYKVYLYFVATEDPAINIARIREVRVPQGGHNVPEDKIRKRYQLSLDLLFEAASLAHQAYFFDNSKDRSADEEKVDYFAHFKLVKGVQVWDKFRIATIPVWFARAYLSKIT